MDEITETPEVVDQPAVPEIPTEPAPPISSRFMFVDVAALRAKQLRRGARLRFEAEPGVPTAIKLERLAMEEVKRGLVYYSVPPVLAKLPDESAS
jgi:DNA-directed RNA polymerase subunit K/omega